LKYLTVSISFDLLSSEKSSTDYQKKRNFALISKMCTILEFGKREKFVKRKTEFFCRDFVGNFLTQEFYTFLKSVQNSASFDTLCAQFQRNFFSTLIRYSAVCLEVKRSNKIETIQYFEKLFFYKLVLGFQGQTKIT
jgi:hypothetical protein